MLKKENYHIGKIKLLILLLSMISLEFVLFFYEDNDAVISVNFINKSKIFGKKLDFILTIFIIYYNF